MVVFEACCTAPPVGTDDNQIIVAAQFLGLLLQWLAADTGASAHLRHDMEDGDLLLGIMQGSKACREAID